MNPSANLLFFEHDSHGESRPRINVSDSELPALVVAARQIRQRLQHGTDVIAAMTCCARAGTEPPAALEREAGRAIDDLGRIARALEELEHVLRGGPAPRLAVPLTAMEAVST